MFTQLQKDGFQNTKIIGLAALSQNNVIGDKGRLILRDTEDMRHFVKTTLGEVVVLGRKTFDSCKRPLLGRSVCVLTKDTTKAYQDALVFNDLETLSKHLSKFRRFYVAGGSEIYKLFEGMYDSLILTRYNIVAIGDTLFPIDLSTLGEVYSYNTLQAGGIYTYLPNRKKRKKNGHK